MHHLIKTFTFALVLFVSAQLPALASVPDSDPVFTFIRARAGTNKAKQLAPVIHREATSAGLSPLVVAKLINRESSFRLTASNGPCAGLMQVDRRYHFKRGESPWTAADNVRAGCRVLAGCFRRYPNWPQALTAYNFGPNHRVTKTLGSSGYARQVLAGK